MAAGFIVSLRLPVGYPRDAGYTEPLVDNVEQAITRVRTRPTTVIQSLAEDLALYSDATGAHVTLLWLPGKTPVRVADCEAWMRRYRQALDPPSRSAVR